MVLVTWFSTDVHSSADRPVLTQSPLMHRKRPKNAAPKADIPRETSRDGKIVFVMQAIILVMVPVLIWSQCIPRTIEPASPSSVPPILAPVTKEAEKQKSTPNLKGTSGNDGFPDIQRRTTEAPKLCVIQSLLGNICARLDTALTVFACL